MNVIILHGDDVKASYKRLSLFIKEAKKRGWEVINDKIEETPSLFLKEKLIVVRDVKLINKKSLKLIEIIPGTLVIYSIKKLPLPFIKNFPKGTKIENYELPFLVWKFLDNMNYKNFQEVVKTQAVEMIFAMISKRLRDIYLVQHGSPKMNNWQINKLKSQYQRLKNKNLKLLISELADIDIKSKTGEFDLKYLLDLFILKRLG